MSTDPPAAKTHSADDSITLQSRGGACITSPAKPATWRLGLRRLGWIFAAWFIFACLPSFDAVRALMIWPLYRSQEIKRADAAYVMADGYAFFERLRAASDLYHQGKVRLIYLTDEADSAWGHDYQRQRSISFTEHSEQYLGLLGVPPAAIRRIPVVDSSMGSLSEAKSFAEQRSQACQSVVVVTSAPHTLRSWLCFRQSLPDGVEVYIYSASEPMQSAELTEPIWHEYLKLLVYWVYLSTFANAP